MLDAGLVREVESLLERGVAPTVKPMLSIGYRQTLEFLGHLEPEASEARPLGLDSLAKAIVRATLRLAKNQRTWFRGQKPAPIWLRESGDASAAEILARLGTL